MNRPRFVILILFVSLATALSLFFFSDKNRSMPEVSRQPDERVTSLPQKSGLETSGRPFELTGIQRDSRHLSASDLVDDDAPGLDPEVVRKWYDEEGYTADDIEEARGLLFDQGYPENMLNDAGLIRRHLLPRVVTSVQISELDVPELVRTGEPIPFTIRGAVPTPEFNFVRYDIVRQGDVIRLRAIGNSAAFDEAFSTAGRMLDVTLSGEIDPLPSGHYRIIIPELGVEGIHHLVVE